MYLIKHSFYLSQKKLCILGNSMSELTSKHFLADLCLLKVVTCSINKCLKSTSFCHVLWAKVKEFLSARTPK